MSKPIILTGLRANSEFHLGNYLGAILPMIELQRAKAGEYQINMFVPDLHSFTTPIDHSKLQKQIMDNLRVFVAAGLDITQPDTYIYRQSYISAHSELTWILSCHTGMGPLERMTQYKEKALQISKNNSVKYNENFAGKMFDYKDMKSLQAEFFNEAEQSINVGLFLYPVLMAADILLYNAEWVPVGEDQRQHLELARDLAIRLNNKFDAKLLTPPHDWNKQLEFSHRDRGVRIRSLRNPEKKMSKSVDDPSGTIMLSDTPEAAAKKVMSATTDSIGVINYNFETQPGISNLLQISALLSGRSTDEVVKEWEGKSSYGDLKKHAAELVSSFLTDFQSRLSSVNHQDIEAKLANSETAMRDVANATLLRVQKAVGLR